MVTLIPKSNTAPHQSVVSKQYHIRAGSDYVPTPHDVLAGMFGRRPQPHVFHNFILSVPELHDGNLKISFGLVVHNEGPGIASDIFSICRKMSLPGSACQMSIDTPDLRNWTGLHELNGQLSLISVPGYRLPPGASAQPMVINLLLRPPFYDELRIFGRVGSGESRRYDFYIEAPCDLVAQQYNDFVERMAGSNFSGPEKQRVVEVFLKTHGA